MILRKINDMSSEYKPQREVEISPSTMTRFDLERSYVELQTFRLSNLECPPAATPGLMETGRVAEVLQQYQNRRDFLHLLYGENLVKIPYTILYGDTEGTFGDFSTPEGQDAFADADVVIEEGENQIPEWAADLHRFAQLKLARRFTFDENLTALRGLERRNGNMRFSVGMSRYSDAFFSMGAEGVRLTFTTAEREALAQKQVIKPSMKLNWKHYSRNCRHNTGVTKLFERLFLGR
jgi:hypothetical protein